MITLYLTFDHDHDEVGEAITYAATLEAETSNGVRLAYIEEPDITTVWAWEEIVAKLGGKVEKHDS